MPVPPSDARALARGGVLPALVTPFRAGDASLDTPALARLASRAVASGCAGVLVAGTTGEAPTLSTGELTLALSATREALDGSRDEASSGLLLAGVGTGDTRGSCLRARAAAEAGADALLVVTPYYSRPTPAGLRRHVEAVAGATDLPVMLYDVPGRTAACLPLELLEHLATLDNVVAYKDATGDLVRAQALRHALGDALALYAGDDALALPFAAIGAVGLVSVTANAFPGEIVRAFALGREGGAPGRDAHARLHPVHQALFAESSPGPLKALLASAGHLEDVLRPPLAPATEETRARLFAVVRAAGLSEALA